TASIYIGLYRSIVDRSGNDVDCPGQGIDPINTRSGAAQYLYPCDGIKWNRQIEAVVCGLGIRNLCPVYQNQGLFKATAINTHVGLCTKGAALPQVHTI